MLLPWYIMKYLKEKNDYLKNNVFNMNIIEFIKKKLNIFIICESKFYKNYFL